eukprot:Colp12_sorted_trinity150504_noHs@30195
MLIENEYDEQAVCTICQDHAAKGNTLKTKCDHTFCKPCLDRHLNIKRCCPNCRTPLSEADVTPHIDLADVMFYYDPFPVEHFGVYVGDGLVIHLSRNTSSNLFGSSSASLHMSMSGMGHHEVTTIKLEEFLRRAHQRNSRVYIRQYRNADPPSKVIDRAFSKLGSTFDGFNLMSNNCEHFAEWCKTGRKTSQQVKTKALGGAAGVAVGFAMGGPVGGVVGGMLGVIASVTAKKMVRDAQRTNM